MPSSPIDIGDECLWFRDPVLGPLYAILLKYLCNHDGSCISPALEKDIRAAMVLCGTGLAGLDFNKYANDDVTLVFRDAVKHTLGYVSGLENAGVEAIDVSTLSDGIGTSLSSNWYEYSVPTNRLLQDATRLMKTIEQYAESRGL